YQYNEKQCMRPASTMKMINAVTTLDKLGGSYLFNTQLRYTGEISSIVNAVIHVLRSELYQWEKGDDVPYRICNLLILCVLPSIFVKYGGKRSSKMNA
ncbi:MAG: D-alanyl-D-alanine carboxypeptidase, partial [Oscillospiraceae bacterium]|nr:D-alanyl-D-alanine carboxypeptidase [Oscillospiraceae bacterium]